MYLDENGLAEFTRKMKEYIDSKFTPTPLEEYFVTFSSASSFTLGVGGSKAWDGDLQYSTNKTNWAIWDGTGTISSASDGTNHKLYVRGIQNTYLTDDWNTSFILTGSEISVSGDSETLLDYATVEQGLHPVVSTNGLAGLFEDQTALVDASGFKTCYNMDIGTCRYMFEGCTNLVYPAENTALMIDENCYESMYQDCTSLVEPAKIVANNTAMQCYDAMYAGCTNLEKLPTFKDTNLDILCYDSMFYNCSKIKLSTTQIGDYVTRFTIPGTNQYPGISDVDPLQDMFEGTGGTFTGTPTANTTYYTSNEIMADKIVLFDNDIVLELGDYYYKNDTENFVILTVMRFGVINFVVNKNNIENNLNISLVDDNTGDIFVNWYMNGQFITNALYYTSNDTTFGVFANATHLKITYDQENGLIINFTGPTEQIPEDEEIDAQM